VKRLPKFRPLPLLTNPHAQTIAAMFWPRGREQWPSAHRLIDLPDGDRLAVVMSTPKSWTTASRTVVLVHGLCGCYRSPYMSRMAGRLFAHGLRAVRINLRGCGSGVGLARHPYHSGRSEDIRRVLEWLALEWPDSPVTLVGYSLGGNIVLKLAGEDASRPSGRLDSVAAVSAPIDLIACSRLIEQRQNRIYESHFVRLLISDVQERQRFFPDLPALDLPSRISLRGFDNSYTAPRSGFRDADEYYHHASSAPLIPLITIPSLLLSARDDPFISPVPYQVLAPLPHVELNLTEHGGHLGFLGFTGVTGDFRWMDHCLLDWIRFRLDSLAHRAV
jgi:hypothetical protein